MSVVVVTFKDEGCDERGRSFGPVVVIRAQGEDAEAAAAAGVPSHTGPQADEVGRKSYREALVIAGEHGVPLTE